MTYLEESHQLSILLDRKALDSAGVDAHQPVTLQLAGEPLEQVLDGVLKPLQLTWIIRDEVILVTTPEEADGHTETRVYKVLQRVANPTAFLSEIKSKVAPKSWDSAGGPGSLSAWPLGAIVVTQTCGVHRQLEQQYGKSLQAVSALAPWFARRPALRPTIKDLLTQPGNFEFAETPLRDVVRWVAENYRIKATLDDKALAAAGVAPDAPVTIRLRGVKLESALNLTLRNFGLLWTVQGDQLAVTTPEAENRRAISVEYNVRDLIYAIPGDSDVLTPMVLTHVTPQMWSQVGGPATLKPAEDGGTLTIKHTFQGHLQVDRLINDLRLFGKT